MELFTVALIGLCIGSFLNVLVDRLSHDQGIMGRSHCDHCKHTLKPTELIPVVSYFLQGGKSRCCQKKLSFFYPMVEVITATAFVLVWQYLPFAFLTDVFPTILQGSLLHIKILMLVLISVLIVMFFADIKYFIIPDWMQILFAVTTFNFFFVGPVDLYLMIFRLGAAVIVMLPLLLIFLITKGRGIGFGDVKLAANLGFLMGITAGLSAIYLSFILGAVFGVIALAGKKFSLKSKIAFGPFIIAGALIVIFCYSWIMNLLQTYYGIY